jgi:hypothetical protein
MVRKAMMIGLLVMSAVALQARDAHAQFDGWGWFGFSEVKGEILTLHTPNPKSKPSQIVVSATMTVQTACVNPATNGVFPGNSFTQTVVGASPAANGGFVETVQGNAGKTIVFLNLSSFEQPEDPHCPNPNWLVLPNSAMALSFSGTVTWCLIDTTTNQLNCSAKNGLQDQDNVTCTLDLSNPLNRRNADGTAPHTAVFTCSQPQ